MTHTNMLEANEVAQEGFAKIEAALNGAPSGKKLFRPSKTDEKTAQTIAQVAQTIRARTQSCIICQRLDSLMDRYFYTLMYMYCLLYTSQRSHRDHVQMGLHCNPSAASLSVRHHKTEQVAHVARGDLPLHVLPGHQHLAIRQFHYIAQLHNISTLRLYKLQ